MDDTQIVIRESRGRKYLGFLLFIIIGTAVLLVQGVLPGIRGIGAEWFFLVIIYVGIYKSPGTSVLITTILGLLFDFYSGSSFGEGLFCCFFVMGSSRVISRVIYADRPLVFSSIACIVSFSLSIVLSLVTLLWGLSVGRFGSVITAALFTAFLTALVSIPFLPLLKFVDPERGGYYLTRFMREEWGEPLV